jgi:hypothetical protein
MFFFIQTNIMVIKMDSKFNNYKIKVNKNSNVLWIQDLSNSKQTLKS